ncbi:MAG: ankyrin repeat domain-containing protein, partial [Candidatus Babeliales bacterium]
ELNSDVGRDGAPKTVDEVIALLYPYSVSRSVNEIVTFFQSIAYEVTLDTLKELATHRLSYQLTRNDLIHIICGITIYYQTDEEKRFDLMDIIISFEDLHAGPPILYVVATNSLYVSAISTCVLWLQKRHAEIYKDEVINAYRHAFQQHQAEVLPQRLYKNGAVLDKKDAELLLWEAAKYNCNENVLRFLIHIGAEVNSEKEGMTPLMFVAQNGTAAQANVLIFAGATVSLKSSVTHKTALDYAIETNNVPVELYLRMNSAREE